MYAYIHGNMPLNVCTLSLAAPPPRTQTSKWELELRPLKDQSVNGSVTNAVYDMKKMGDRMTGVYVRARMRVCVCVCARARAQRYYNLPSHNDIKRLTFQTSGEFLKHTYASGLNDQQMTSLN